jgi:hypothetical protein
LRKEVLQLALSRETGPVLSTQALALPVDGDGAGGAGSSVAIAEATARVPAATSVVTRVEKERVSIEASWCQLDGRDPSGPFE